MGVEKGAIEVENDEFDRSRHCGGVRLGLFWLYGVPWCCLGSFKQLNDK